MSIDTTRYCLSFIPGSFSPDDLVKLVQRDLGFSKDQVVPSSSGFSIGEGESFGGRRFSFMTLENDTAQDNIFWVLKGQEPPPSEVFNELLSHPGFVFALPPSALPTIPTAPPSSDMPVSPSAGRYGLAKKVSPGFPAISCFPLSRPTRSPGCQMASSKSSFSNSPKTPSATSPSARSKEPSATTSIWIRL